MLLPVRTASECLLLTKLTLVTCRSLRQQLDTTEPATIASLCTTVAKTGAQVCRVVNCFLLSVKQSSLPHSSKIEEENSA